MQTWINFWTILFWLSLVGFILNPSNFINLLFYSEILWAILYCLSVLIGCMFDDINAASLSFFILGFAGLEFAVGLLLLIFFKNNNITTDFSEDQKIWKQYLLKNEKYFYSTFKLYN